MSFRLVAGVLFLVSSFSLADQAVSVRLDNASGPGVSWYGTVSSQVLQHGVYWTKYCTGMVKILSSQGSFVQYINTKSGGEIKAVAETIDCEPLLEAAGRDFFDTMDKIKFGDITEKYEVVNVVEGVPHKVRSCYLTAVTLRPSNAKKMDGMPVVIRYEKVQVLTACP